MLAAEPAARGDRRRRRGRARCAAVPALGPPLEALVTRGGRATLVVEPPALPLPGAPVDPRQAALAATIDELTRLGVPSSGRRSSSRAGSPAAPAAESSRRCSRPTARRAFRARSRHDAEDRRARLARPRRRHAAAGQPAARRHRSRRHGDRGGDRAARRAGRAGRRRRRRHDPRGRRRSRCSRPPASSGWQLGLALERALAGRVAPDRRLARARPAAADRARSATTRTRTARSSSSRHRRSGASHCSRRWFAGRSSRGSGAS